MSEQDAASVDRFLDGLDDRRDERAGEDERRRARRAVPKWEYMRWRVRNFHLKDAYIASVDDADVAANTRALSPALERAGDEGWELVSAAPLGQGGVGVLIFKRPKGES
jgi:hypothetical protein